MLNDIYNQRILELAGSIPRVGRLDAPHATATAHSKLCGSTVIVDLRMAQGRVVDFAQDVRACALGQAAASIVGRHVIGATAEELCAIRDGVRAMLKANGSPPVGQWADAAVLEPVRDYKARHASTLLAFEAAAEAASKIDSRAPALGEVSSGAAPQ
jgi:NifU-like protein involved in Fe-S cluster formation